MSRGDTSVHTAIRLATAADVPALFTIRTSVRENHLDLAQLAVRGVTPASVTASLLRERAATWVIDAAGEVRAFCMADADEGTIFALFVHPGGEGRGYGRALLRRAEAWLFGAGCETIWLHTDAQPHFRAHGFYRAAGWVLVGPADRGDVRYEKTRTG